MNILTKLLLGAAAEEVKRQRLKQKRLLAILEVEKKLAEVRQIQDDPSAMQLLLELASLRAKVPEVEAADKHFQEATELAHYMKDKPLEIFALLKHGHFHKDRMDYIRAEACYLEALTLARDIQSSEHEQRILKYLVDLRNMKEIDDLSRSIS